MVGSGQSLLIGFYLFSMVCYVYSGDENVPGDDLGNLHDDVAKQDLDKVNSSICERESTSRVLYKANIEAIEEIIQDLEKENKKLQKELELATERHAQVVADLEDSNEKTHQESGAYQAKLDKLTQQLEKIKNENLELKNRSCQRCQINEFNHNMKREIEIMRQNLQDVKYLILNAKDAQTEQVPTPARDKLFPIPYEDKIKALERKVTESIYVSNYNDKVSRLYALQHLFNALLEKLYTESGLPKETAIKDLEHRFNVEEMDILIKREDQNSRIISLRNKMRDNNFSSSEEKEIATLHDVEKKVQMFDKSLQDINRQRAYLNSIMKVIALLEECNHAIKYAYPDQVSLGWF